MADLPDFQKKQFAFAAHIRDPDHVAAPAGVEDRRMAIYRELFFNNIRNLLSNMFPVLKKLHTTDKWESMIRQFMQKHRAETPYFLQLPQEFLDFLQNEYSNDLSDVDRDGDLLANVPVKSALTWVYAYQYPVHRISPDNLPTEPAEQPVYLAVYRRDNDKVGFLELNPITARLLEAIEQNDAMKSGENLLRGLAVEIDYPDVDALIQHGATALDEMKQLEILIGTRLPA